MAWVRLDDKFPHNPKVLRAGPLGLAMHVAAICYCNQHLTDGFLPRQAASTLLDFSGLAMHVWDNGVMGGGNDAEWQMVVDDLVKAGLWIESDDGWRLHDYLEYQSSKTQVLQARSQNASRQAKWRNGESNTVTNDVSNTISNANVTAAPRKKEEGRRKKELECSAKPRRVRLVSPDFEKFYSAYPSKTNRAAAEKAWPRALEAAGTLEIIMVGLDRYKRTKPDWQQWAHPASWLNGRRWEDQPQLETVAEKDTFAAERAALEAWLKPSRVPGGFWMGQGPPPDDLGSTLPAALKAEYADRIRERSEQLKHGVAA